MLSVQEICRRRREKKESDPCGLYRNQREVLRLEQTSTERYTKMCEVKMCITVNGARVLNKNRQKKENISHMTPVIKVVEKRSRGRNLPPGISSKILIDLNNNSGKKKKEKSHKSKSRDGSSKGRYEEYTNTLNKEKKAKIFVNCLDGVKSDLNDIMNEAGVMRPDCLKGEVDTRKNKTEKGKPKKKEKSNTKSKVDKLSSLFLKRKNIEGKTFVAPIIKTDIADEEVIVNILPADNEDNSGLEFDDRFTPENYEETFAYFERISEARTDLFRCLYILGDMLLADELDGDQEDWKSFLERSEVETIAWQEKCKQSNEYFQKTRKIIGQDESLFHRLFRSIKTKASNVFHLLIEACPLRCFSV